MATSSVRNQVKRCEAADPTQTLRAASGPPDDAFVQML
jgi:hypothetical protein